MDKSLIITNAQKKKIGPPTIGGEKKITPTSAKSSGKLTARHFSIFSPLPETSVLPLRHKMHDTKVDAAPE